MVLEERSDHGVGEKSRGNLEGEQLKRRETRA